MTSRPVPPRPRLHRLLRHWGVEVAAVVVVAFGGLVALGHFATSSWAQMMLYDADSLVLPLVEKSMHAGQPFQWVFSSQLFIFPEGLVYGISSIATDDPRVVLAINLVLNLVGLYLLLRVTTHLLARRSRHRFLEISAALVATGLFGAFVLLEPQPHIGGSTIASLYLLSTYYYGVIMVGLAVVALVLWATSTFGGVRPTRPRAIGYAVAAFLIVGVATMSDPLVLMQVIAPVGLALLVLWFAARIDGRTLLLLGGVLAAAGVVGFLARRLLRAYVQAEVGSYLALSQIPDSAKLHLDALLETLETPQGTLKLLLAGGVILVSLALFATALFVQARPRLAGRITTAEFFLSAFVSISTLSLPIGEVLSGSLTTRYLEPLFVFPLLVMIAIGVKAMRWMLLSVDRADLRRSLAVYSSGVMVAGSAVVIVCGVLAIPPTGEMLRGDTYTLSDCLDEELDGTDANAVATFWLARPLELYGSQDGIVAQVSNDLEPFPWMNNLDDYDREFSYVLIDRIGFVTEDSVAGLGEPVSVTSCGAYDVLDYTGTPGEEELNRIIREGLEEALEEKGY
ncbi:MAG: hypothetical protein QM675_01885 [Protaetiibacter sp.]